MPTRNKIKILVLVDQRLVPKYKSINALAKRSINWTMEADVFGALLRLGYQVEVFGVQDSVFDLIQKINSYKLNYKINFTEKVFSSIPNSYICGNIIFLLFLLS